MKRSLCLLLGLACAAVLLSGTSLPDVVAPFKPGSVEEQRNEIPAVAVPLETVFTWLESEETTAREGALLWLLRSNKAVDLSYFAFPQKSIRFGVDRVLRKDVDGIIWRLVECRYLSRQTFTSAAEYRAVWKVAYLFDDLGQLRDWIDDYDVLFLDDLNGDGNVELFAYINSPKRVIMYSYQRGRSRQILRVESVPEGSDAIDVVPRETGGSYKVRIAAHGIYQWDKRSEQYVKSASVPSNTTLALREAPVESDSRELISRLLSDNQHWLQPAIRELAYTFSMRHTARDDLYEVTIQYRAPNHVTITKDDETDDREVDNSYDPNNTAYPPRLLTILQGVTFFGPMQELALAPEDHELSVLGTELIDGREALVMRLIPTGQPSQRAISEWEERLRESATRPKYQYELVPVEKETNGAKRAVIELKCLFEEGPSGVTLQEALKANPAQLKWEGQIYTAFILQCRDQKRPQIAVENYRHVSVLPRVILEEGDSQFSEALYDALKTASWKPERYLAMRVGCGVWGCWYGYSGGGAEADQVCIDKLTGVVLREEGLRDGKRRFTVEYGEFEELADGKLVPQHVVISLYSEEQPHPWVFDMTFGTYDGSVWLLKKLAEFQGGKLSVTAWTSDVIARK